MQRRRPGAGAAREDSCRHPAPSIWEVGLLARPSPVPPAHPPFILFPFSVRRNSNEPPCRSAAVLHLYYIAVPCWRGDLDCVLLFYFILRFARATQPTLFDRNRSLIIILSTQGGRADRRRQRCHRQTQVCGARRPRRPGQSRRLGACGARGPTGGRGHKTGPEGVASYPDLCSGAPPPPPPPPPLSLAIVASRIRSIASERPAGVASASVPMYWERWKSPDRHCDYNAQLGANSEPHVDYTRPPPDTVQPPTTLPPPSLYQPPPTPDRRARAECAHAPTSTVPPPSPANHQPLPRRCTTC